MQVTISAALADPMLFARWFGGESWGAWRAFLKAVFGEPLDAEELAIFANCTSRATAPAQQFREAALVIGRRGGKSRALALIAVFVAAFRDYTAFIAPGETPTVGIIAADRKQARVILRYVSGLLHAVPLLSDLVDEAFAESIRLTNGVVIEVGVASIAAPRGRTYIAVLTDEVAFWRSDDNAANPDTEVLGAVRPGLASIPGSMLLLASSPYAKRGALWTTYRKNFGKDDARTLVWQAPTLTMNPTLDPRVVEEAYETDAASAAAEYGAQFRDDLSSLLDAAVIDAAVMQGTYERHPVSDVSYVGFVDPSGGSSDSFTLAIGHKESRDGADVAVIDAIRERKPPFSPEAVVADFADLLKAFRVTTVFGDKYAGEFPRELFRRRGITYEPAAKPKSDIYRDVVSAFNSRAVLIPDHPRLVAQLAGLERRIGQGGRDRIDHTPGAHDDVANAACGAVARLLSGASTYAITDEFVGGLAMLTASMAMGNGDPYFHAGSWHIF